MRPTQKSQLLTGSRIANKMRRDFPSFFLDYGIGRCVELGWLPPEVEPIVRDAHLYILQMQRTQISAYKYRHTESSAMPLNAYNTPSPVPFYFKWHSLGAKVVGKLSLSRKTVSYLYPISSISRYSGLEYDRDIPLKGALLDDTFWIPPTRRDTTGAQTDLFLFNFRPSFTARCRYFNEMSEHYQGTYHNDSYLHHCASTEARVEAAVHMMHLATIRILREKYPDVLSLCAA